MESVFLAQSIGLGGLNKWEDKSQREECGGGWGRGGGCQIHHAWYFTMTEVESFLYQSKFSQCAKSKITQFLSVFSNEDIIALS